MVNPCVCGSIGAPGSVRFCDECHRYWRGDKELLSVSKVLRSAWPFKPDFSKADPATIENARDRGIVVDRLFTSYLRGTLTEIEPGTRTDAVELFFKLKKWWDGRHSKAEAQVLLAGEDVAGTCDVLADGEVIYDIKATHDIEAMYQLQLGAYADLHFATFSKPVKSLGIIHVTKRYREPKLIKVDLGEALRDWMLLRDTYRMAQRRTA